MGQGFLRWYARQLYALRPAIYGRDQCAAKQAWPKAALACNDYYEQFRNAQHFTDYSVNHVCTNAILLKIIIYTLRNQ